MLEPTPELVESTLKLIRAGRTWPQVAASLGVDSRELSRLRYRVARVQRGKVAFPEYLPSLPVMGTSTVSVQPMVEQVREQNNKIRSKIAEKFPMSKYTAENFKKMSEKDQEAFVDSLAPEELDFLEHDWDFWARDGQLLPPGDWTYWVVQAGRGFGKTRTGSEAVREWIRQGFNYVNIAGATADDARVIMIEGESGILAVCPKSERPIYQGSKRQLLWPNGAITLIFTADEPERFRGKQHQKLWADELAAWRYPEAWDQAQFGLRIGAKPQCIVTTTPRPTKLIRELITSDSVVFTRGTTYENRENLAPEFYAKIITKYEGTRLGRQELNAELLEDNPGALFFLANIEKNRVSQLPPEDQLERIVVGVDPPATSNENSDECGLVAAARDKRTPCHFYVFEDKSDIMSPEQWGAKCVEMYHVNRGDRIVGEVNNGGEMVERVIRTTPRRGEIPSGENVAYTAVHATRGKELRAEPISGLYEQNRVHHVGILAKLEDQMCAFNPQTWSRAKDGSPDRMDAAVWALTDLSDGYLGQGLIEYMASGQAQRDLNAMTELKASIMSKVKGKGNLEGVKSAGSLAKPAVGDETPKCPKCGSVVLHPVSGSVVRCGNCSETFDLGSRLQTDKPMSRSDVLQKLRR